MMHDAIPRRSAAFAWRLAVGLAATLLVASQASAGTFAATTWSDYRTVRSQVEAAQFLTRATFGPTKADIATLAEDIRRRGRRRALSDWIDAEFAKPPTYHRDMAYAMVADDGYTPTQAGVYVERYRQTAWWHTAVAGDDQLRQRVAWALSQIFVISEVGQASFSDTSPTYGHPGWIGPANYYDMLVDHAGGNYRDALTDVTLSPIMGVYLSHLKNRKADPAIGRFPDENYAREVMQLFTIGTRELSANGTVRLRRGRPVATYDNDDIKEFARVFTGLTNNGGAGFFSGRNFEQPMRMYEPEHDADAKALLRGATIPAGQPGLDDISDALDNLFNHPNCPPFVARLLIQRLVKSNPSKGYVYRVARAFRNNGQGVRGDMKAVVKAILTDREATNSCRRLRVRGPGGSLLGLEVRPRGTEFSSLREPVLRYTALMRAFDAASDYPTGRIMLESVSKTIGQSPYQSSSVFNFYLPDHTPQGTMMSYRASRRLANRQLVAPEFQIYTTVFANKLANLLHADIYDASVDRTIYNPLGQTPDAIAITLDFSEEETLAAADMDGLLAHLDLLLCSGTMSDAARAIIVDAIATESLGPQEQARLAIMLVMTSPDCAVAN